MIIITDWFRLKITDDTLENSKSIRKKIKSLSSEFFEVAKERKQHIENRIAEDEINLLIREK